MKRNKLDNLIAKLVKELEASEEYQDFKEEVYDTLKKTVEEYREGSNDTIEEMYEEISYPPIESINSYAQSLTGLLVKENILDPNKLTDEDRMYISDQIALYWIEVRKEMCKKILGIKKKGGN
jgi:polyhydroxyalkanoate synthesis regulator phasin